MMAGTAAFNPALPASAIKKVPMLREPDNRVPT
jgi:hypothetical protein